MMEAFELIVLLCLCIAGRILECEKQPGITGGKIPVEIWDVSGDQAWVLRAIAGIYIMHVTAKFLRTPPPAASGSAVSTIQSR